MLENTTIFGIFVSQKIFLKIIILTSKIKYFKIFHFSTKKFNKQNLTNNNFPNNFQNIPWNFFAHSSVPQKYSYSLRERGQLQ